MTTTMTHNTQDADASPFVLPLPPPPADMSRAEFALYCAVLHHGLTNLWVGDFTPASKQTCCVTADFYYDWLSKKEASQR